MGYAAVQISGEWCYATRADVLAFCGLAGVTLPQATLDLLDDIIEGVSRSIDLDCRRNFYKEDGATRKFSGNTCPTLPIDDFRTLTSITVDGEMWTAGTDFEVSPFNSRTGFPKTALVALNDHTWVSEPRGISVVADWGWVAVPQAIHLACLNRAKAQWALRDQDTNLKSLYTGDFRVELADPKTIRDREIRQVAKYVRATA